MKYKKRGGWQNKSPLNPQKTTQHIYDWQQFKTSRHSQKYLTLHNMNTTFFVTSSESINIILPTVLIPVCYLKRLLLILLISFSTFSYSNSAIDSAQSAKNKGHFEIALSHWQTALPYANHQQQIQLLLQITEAYLSIGQIQEALDSIKTADKLIEKTGTQTEKAQFFALYSDIFLLTRKLDLAHAYAKKSAALAGKIQDKTIQATVFNQLGNVQMAMHKYQNALQSYVKASNLISEPTDNDLKSKLLINSIHAQLALNSIDKAIPTIHTSLTSTLLRKDSFSKAMDLIALGNLSQQVIEQEGDNNPLQKWAYQAYKAALTIANATNNTQLQSYANGHLGQLYLAAEKFADAETLLRKAVFTATASQMPELSARWYWQLGRLHRQQKQHSEAIAFYQKSIADLEEVQSALIYGFRGKPKAFRNTIGVIYLELADLLLQQSKLSNNPQRQQLALSDVKQVMEKFKTFELKNYFQDDCVTDLQHKLIATPVDKILEPTTATLYPIILPDRLILLLTLDNGMTKQFETLISSNRLKQNVFAFQQQLLRPGNTRRVKSIGLMFYEWLIKPIEQQLINHDIDTLVIIPDDVLRAIPYAALFDGKDFLIEKYALAVTPGLSLTNKVSSKKSNRPILLSGLSDAVQNFSPLPFVTQEITRIASVYDDNKLFINQDFQKNKIREQLSGKSYSAAIFATHAHLDADPKQSFLLTYDNKISLDELEQFIRKTRFHDEGLDLLVLSACDTARGDERAMLGLAGIAVKSGANSVLASLWSVNDASTSELIPAFFEWLKNQNVSKAKALQLAQKQLLGNRQYQHPYFWAGFVLIGAWQ